MPIFKIGDEVTIFNRIGIIKDIIVSEVIAYEVEINNSKYYLNEKVLKKTGE